MEENKSTQREIAPGIGQHGSSGDCPTEGFSVFKWNVDHFELEAGGNHCKPGYSPPPPPVPTAEERSQLETFDEFRAYVCCSGSSGSSGDPS